MKKRFLVSIIERIIEYRGEVSRGDTSVGLCFITSNMARQGLLTTGEEEAIGEFFEANRPSKTLHPDLFEADREGKGWWWQVNDGEGWEVRTRFLNRMLEIAKS